MYYLEVVVGHFVMVVFSICVPLFSCQPLYLNVVNTFWILMAHKPMFGDYALHPCLFLTPKKDFRQEKTYVV